MERLDRLPLWLDLVLRDFAKPATLDFVSPYDARNGDTNYDDSICYTLKASSLYPASEGVKFDISIDLSTNEMELVAWNKKEEGCSKTVNLNLESATFADFKLAASELLLSFWMNTMLEIASLK